MSGCGNWGKVSARHCSNESKTEQAAFHTTVRRNETRKYQRYIPCGWTYITYRRSNATIHQNCRLPREGRKSKLSCTAMVTMSDASITESEGMPNGQIHTFVGDGGHDLKRDYEAMLAENIQLRAENERRKKRKSKKNEKGNEFKKLESIPTENRLTETQECALGKMTRYKVWPDMKYYIGPYRGDLLEMSYVSLGIKTKNDQERYADHIICYVDKKLSTHTHNCVGYIKRKVCGGGENGGT